MARSAIQVKIDAFHGEATLILTDRFNSMPALYRADILQDLLLQIDEAYEDAQADLHAWLVSIPVDEHHSS